MNAIFYTITFFALHFNYSEDYLQIFGDDYKNALTFVTKNKTKFVEVFENDSALIRTSISIVFPELIRYSMVRDFFETAVLETFYVQYGSDAADFSIGSFQMKPSFIEVIEQYAFDNNSSTYQKISFASNFSEKEKRQERLNRLQEIKWQILYLKIFIELYSEKEAMNQFPNSNDKIIYLATAYNRGLNTSIAQLDLNKILFKDKFFPYGLNYPGKQYSYAAIALDFYQNYKYD